MKRLTLASVAVAAVGVLCGAATAQTTLVIPGPYGGSGSSGFQTFQPSTGGPPFTIYGAPPVPQGTPLMLYVPEPVGPLPPTAPLPVPPAFMVPGMMETP